MNVWLGLLGVKPGKANRALFGHGSGAYFWVAAPAKDEGDFRNQIEVEMRRRGLSLDEVTDVMPANDARQSRPEIDWEPMIEGAAAESRLVIGSNFFIHEET